MSNLIKAYNIRYGNQIKEIDSNAKLEQIFKKYDLPFAAAREGERPNAKPVSEDGFQPGFGNLPVAEPVGDKAPAEQPDLLGEQEDSREKIIEESQKILEDARAEVKRILKDGMDQAAAEAEELKQQVLDLAREEGYQEGLNKAKKEIADLQENLEAQDRLRLEAYEKQVQELEPAFVELIISLLHKLTGEVLEEKRSVVYHLIHQAIRKQESSKNYLIKVSRDDYDAVLQRKPDLLACMREGAVVEIVEDLLLKPAQCLIETESRLIDCSLDTQMKQLISDLKLLSGGLSALEG